MMLQDESVAETTEVAAKETPWWSVAQDIWNLELVTIEDRAVTVGSVVIFLVLLSFGTWAAKIASKVIARIIRRRFKFNEGVAAAVQTIVFYVLFLTIALLALRIVNVPITVFAVLGGALAIGLGFGSQNIVNNFISGLILLVERPIRVGDLVQVGGLHAVIRSIGARSTRVVTGDNIEIVVPNSSFLAQNVTNLTLTSDELRGNMQVGVAYGSPVREVERLLLKAADEHASVLKEPGPTVLFTEFGDNSLVFTLYFWVRIRRMFERRRVESDLRFRTDELFREAGIVIAFPQRDVHIDAGTPVPVRIIDRERNQP